jgi:Tol biopolymer transport system component
MRYPLALLVLALLAAFPATAGATWPGKSGKIVYFGVDDADDEGARDGIYSVGPNGGRNRRIVRLANGDVASSRNGRRIAFFRTDDQLWQARSDGSHARRIVRLRHGSGSRPAWSPSGKRLVLTVFLKRKVGRKLVEVEEVWVVRRDGKGLHKLRRGHDAIWSSRGLIAYAQGDGDVATMHPNGRGRHIWVPQGSPAIVRQLDFSPDGRRLVYQQSTSKFTKYTIRTVNLRTGRRTRFRDLTKQVSAHDVAWAPGGRRIAYVHAVGQDAGRNQLRTIRPNGNGRRTLFEFPPALVPFDFAWQTR